MCSLLLFLFFEPFVSYDSNGGVVVVVVVVVVGLFVIMFKCYHNITFSRLYCVVVRWREVGGNSKL